MYICFVYKKVGRISTQNLFTTFRISEEERSQIRDRVQMNRFETDIINDDLLKKFQDICVNEKKPSSDIATVPRNINEDCPICFDTMIGQEITTCKECNNCVHKLCLENWMTRKNTCVYCRTIIQVNKPKKKSSTSSKFVNLNA